MPPCCVNTCCDARLDYPKLKCYASRCRGYGSSRYPGRHSHRSSKSIGCGSNGAYVEGAQCSLEYVEPSPDPRLARKDDGNLCPLVVMSVLLDTQYLDSPPPHAVAFLQHHLGLVKVNQILPWHMEYTKRRRTVKNHRHKTDHPAAASGSLR